MGSILQNDEEINKDVTQDISGITKMEKGIDGYLWLQSTYQSSRASFIILLYIQLYSMVVNVGL